MDSKDAPPNMPSSKHGRQGIAGGKQYAVTLPPISTTEKKQLGKRSRLNETVTQFGHCNGETATHQPDLIGTKVPDSTAAHVAPAVQPGVVKAEEAAVSKHSRTLRVLTYNVGLLAWRAPGGRALFENPPYVDGRKAQVAPVILDTKADIICLQECYEMAHFQELAAALREAYPYHARVDTGGRLRFHNGLAVFSRYEILDATLLRHKHAALVEQLLATKAMLMVHVLVPGVGVCTMINTHLTAGLYPVGAAAIKTRGAQVQEALDAAASAEACGSKAIFIVGDLNAGPQAAPDNYFALISAGWRDAWVEANGEDASGGITWDPKNALNLNGVHENCTPQRCDHIFISPVCRHLTVKASDVECKQLVAHSNSSRVTSASDHYAVVADVLIS